MYSNTVRVIVQHVVVEATQFEPSLPSLNPPSLGDVSLIYQSQSFLAKILTQQDYYKSLELHIECVLSKPTSPWPSVKLKVSSISFCHTHRATRSIHVIRGPDRPSTTKIVWTSEGLSGHYNSLTSEMLSEG